MVATKAIFPQARIALVGAAGWILALTLVACSAGGSFGGQDNKDKKTTETSDQHNQPAKSGSGLDGAIDPQVDSEFEPANQPGMVSGAMLTCIGLSEPERDAGLRGYGCSITNQNGRKIAMTQHRVEWSLVDQAGASVGEVKAFDTNAPFHAEVVLPKDRVSTSTLQAQIFWRGWPKPESLKTPLPVKQDILAVRYGAGVVYHLGDKAASGSSCNLPITVGKKPFVNSKLSAPFKLNTSVKTKIIFATVCGVDYPVTGRGAGVDNMVRILKGGEAVYSEPLPPRVTSYELPKILDLAAGDYEIVIESGVQNWGGATGYDDFLLGDIFIIGVRQ